MPRVNLSIDDALYAKLAEGAKGKGTTVNLLIIDLLEHIYLDSVAFDYSSALKMLVDEAEEYAKSHEDGGEFTLAKLSSFANISVTQANKSNVRPSIVRARLGKMFNAKVYSGNVKGVARAINSKGNKKFKDNTVIYAVRKDNHP